MTIGKGLHAKTTVWRRGPDGLTLVRTFDGLPYGTATNVVIPGLGEAHRSGIQTSGSGKGEAITEVQFTLK